MTDDATKLAPYVESHPGIHGGDPCAAGTRINTCMVYAAWKYGGEAQVVADYPSLKREQVMCAVAFEAGRTYERAHPSNHDELMIALAAALSDFNYIDNDATERILEFALDVAREQE